MVSQTQKERKGKMKTDISSKDQEFPQILGLDISQDYIDSYIVKYDKNDLGFAMIAIDHGKLGEGDKIEGWVKDRFVIVKDEKVLTDEILEELFPSFVSIDAIIHRTQHYEDIERELKNLRSEVERYQSKEKEFDTAIERLDSWTKEANKHDIYFPGEITQEITRLERAALNLNKEFTDMTKEIKKENERLKAGKKARMKAIRALIDLLISIEEI